MSRPKASPRGNVRSPAKSVIALPVPIEPLMVPPVPASLAESPGPELWAVVWEGGGSFYMPAGGRVRWRVATDSVLDALLL